mgnify:CR=1 FL=1
MYHDVSLLREQSELKGGDILFLISCNEMISKSARGLFTKTLVIHAGDLPKDRGWSPHIWAIVRGDESITVSLFEADDKIDNGDVWQKLTIEIPKHALWDEINTYLFNAELRLMNFALDKFDVIEPEAQNHQLQPTYLEKRTPEDSAINAHRSIAEQFDLIRVCDPKRFPAYFKIHGHTYKVYLEKM